MVTEGDGVLGWSSVAGSRDSDGDPETGELWAMYVNPTRWRRGIGRTLWTGVEAYLKAAGYTEVTVWVLKESEKAVSFYVSLGFTMDVGTEKTIELGGARLAEIRLRRWLGS